MLKSPNKHIIHRRLLFGTCAHFWIQICFFFFLKDFSPKQNMCFMALSQVNISYFLKIWICAAGYSPNILIYFINTVTNAHH